MKEEIPALLIFKDNYDLINILNMEERGQILTAICKYAIDKTKPENLSDKLMMCFLSFKRDIDRNEKRYLDKVEKTKERNRLAYSKQKEMKNKEQKPGQKPEQKKQKANKSPPMTEEQTRFLQRFKEICPDKEIDCNIAEMPTCDYDALMLEIKKSPQFLIVSKNLTLKWCLEHSADIISGKYRETSSEPPTKQKNINHTYSPEELNALFQKPDEVDI